MKQNNKHKKSDAWGYSVKRLPWDDYDNPADLSGLSPDEQLISSTVHLWYDSRHLSASDYEIKFINNIDIQHCPICGSKAFHKNGFYRDGTQCYRCNDCGHSFSPLTGTIFEDHKIPISEWIEYLLYLFEFHSITTSARDGRNAESTGKYWLLKVFTVLEHIQDDVVLSGNVYFDEMFFSVIERKKEKKDGKELRGISRNKIAVAVACDENGHKVMIDEMTSKPSKHSTWEAMGKHIKSGSHLIHDGENSHSILVEKLSLTEEIYPTSVTKKLPDKDNPLDPINDLHSLIRRYMRVHGGYDRSHLQDWMNLISFILSDPVNRYEKVKKFINIAIISPQKVKYRDVMSRKKLK